MCPLKKAGAEQVGSKMRGLSDPYESWANRNNAGAQVNYKAILITPAGGKHSQPVSLLHLKIKSRTQGKDVSLTGLGWYYI